MIRNVRLAALLVALALIVALYELAGFLDSP